VKVKWVPVGKLFSLERRSVNVVSDQNYQEVGVRSFGKGLFIKEPLTGVDLGTKRVFWIKNGDLIVSNVFAWEGAIGLAGPDHDGLIGSHRFMTWVPQSDDFSTQFILEFFRSRVGVSRLADASPGSAGRNRTLSIKNFEEVLVPLPSHANQDRIAARLDSLSKVPVGAEQSAAKAEALLINLRETIIGQLAQQDTVTLGEALRSIDQLENVDPQATYPMLGVRSFGRGAFDSGAMTGDDTAYKRLRRFWSGQVCYPKLMAWQGALAVIPEDLNGHYASPEFVGFDIDSSKACSAYLSHCLAWSGLLEETASRSTGTNANRRRLQPMDFLSIKIPLPSLTIQERAASTLDRAKQASSAAHQAATYAAAILPAARNEIFSGLAHN
jgi:hypothetical protein